jgi:hypothetical protein
MPTTGGLRRSWSIPDSEDGLPLPARRPPPYYYVSRASFPPSRDRYCLLAGEIMSFHVTPIYLTVMCGTSQPTVAMHGEDEDLLSTNTKSSEIIPVIFVYLHSIIHNNVNVLSIYLDVS